MKRTIWTKIAALAVSCSMCLSMGVKAEGGGNAKLDEGAWTEIYLDYLDGLNSVNDDQGGGGPGLSYLRAELLYLDYNDIPEILLQSDQDEQGGLLLSIDGTQVIERSIPNINSNTEFSYKPHSNVIRILEKKTRNYSEYEERVYSTKDGALDLLFRGGVESNSSYYYYEGDTKVPIPHEEYWDVFHKAFNSDPEKSIRGYTYAMEDLIEEFEKRREKFLADKKDKKEAPGWRQIYLDYLRNLKENGSYVYEDNLILYLDWDKNPEIILHGKDASDYYVTLTTDGKYLMEKKVIGNGSYKVSTEKHVLYFYGASDDGNYDKVFKIRNGFIFPGFDGVWYEGNAGGDLQDDPDSAIIYEANGIPSSEMRYSSYLGYQFPYIHIPDPKKPYSIDDLLSLLEDPEAEIPGTTWDDAD